MSVGVARLRTWNPEALESAADDLEASRRRLDDITGDLNTAVRMLEQGWEGDAAVAAVGSIRTQARVGADLVDALRVVRRSMHAAADALPAAKALLARAEDLATEYGLVLTDTGVQPVGAAASDELRAARFNVRAMIRQALEAADDADRDAAHAVRAALEPGAGQMTAREERDLIEDISLHDVPVGTSTAAVAHWWASLSPTAQALMLRRHPDRIGNLDGMPYDIRVEANRMNITDAVSDARGEERELQARLDALTAEIDTEVEYRGMGQALVDTRAALAACQERLAMYENLLTETTTGYNAAGNRVPLEGHQVVVFDPANGRFAEIVGSIGPRTDNIAVLVPGTGANVLNMDGQYDRALDFVTSRYVNPPGSLAVITYLGGDLPQQVIFEAFETHYALDQADGLARFTAGIDNPTDASVTVAGHSYGGSVVGAAEAAGMHVDRILHIESAGAGPGVAAIDDYAYLDTDRYSMTAPGDPITLAQGTSVGPLGHGSDPDALDNVVRLETGLVDHLDRSSDLLQGGAAHSGVFTPGSTAWRNILNVMTGGEVMLYTEPGWVQSSPDRLLVDDFRYPMEDPTFQPPTLDIE